LAFALPSSAINSYLDYIGKKLALCFRESLTLHFHNKYLDNMNYYKITNLDSRISNPDQRLTTDIEKWSSSLSTFYTNFTKPILDIVLFSKKLAELIGW
jgi:ATP-binding cassette subfamily D (ALD) protein 3